VNNDVSNNNATNQLVLWGRSTSTNVQKVLWLLTDLQQPFRHIEVGGPFGGLDTPEFKLLNPNRRIPVLQHNGNTFWESHAILRYLAHVYRRVDLYPTDPVIHGHVNMWLDWHVTVLWPPIRLMFLSHFKSGELSWEHPAIMQARVDLYNALGLLADQLKQHEFVAGSSFTLADIPLSIGIGRLRTMELAVDVPEEIENWWKRIAGGQSYELIKRAEQKVRRATP
jgi:glutathione S-transferase